MSQYVKDRFSEWKCKRVCNFPSAEIFEAVASEIALRCIFLYIIYARERVTSPRQKARPARMCLAFSVAPVLIRLLRGVAAEDGAVAVDFKDYPGVAVVAVSVDGGEGAAPRSIDGVAVGREAHLIHAERSAIILHGAILLVSAAFQFDGVHVAAHAGDALDDVAHLQGLYVHVAANHGLGCCAGLLRLEKRYARKSL